MIMKRKLNIDKVKAGFRFHYYATNYRVVGRIMDGKKEMVVAKTKRDGHWWYNAFELSDMVLLWHTAIFGRV